MKKSKNKKRRSFRPSILEVYKDLKAYKMWRGTIKAERDNNNSKYNKFGLNHNYFYILYLPITLPQEDSALPDSIKRLRVMESLNPIHQYLDYELGFSDYIIPEFNQFYDDEGNPTLTYGIVYRFAFKKLSLKWVLRRIISWSIITWALIKWPILSTLWGWIF
jgi:hypothetical protein